MQTSLDFPPVLNRLYERTVDIRIQIHISMEYYYNIAKVIIHTYIIQLQNLLITGKHKSKIKNFDL